MDNISPSPSLDTEVLTFSDSQPPFSDRLMLNHAVLLNSYGIGNYGMSLAQNLRHDLAAMYGKMIVETEIYANSGAGLLIQNKWLEQPTLISKHS